MFCESLSNSRIYAGGTTIQPRRQRSEEHTSELQPLRHLVCRLLRPPLSTLFPYTTLFRSRCSAPTGRCSARACRIRVYTRAVPPSSPGARDRKSTRLNSSHLGISYAGFSDHLCLHSFPTRRSSDLDARRRQVDVLRELVEFAYIRGRYHHPAQAP